MNGIAIVSQGAPAISDGAFACHRQRDGRVSRSDRPTYGN
jgi:hypothetical protein